MKRQKFTKYEPSPSFLYLQHSISQTSNFQNSTYLRSFLREKARFKQRIFSKKELCEIGEEAI